MKKYTIPIITAGIFYTLYKVFSYTFDMEDTFKISDIEKDLKIGTLERNLKDPNIDWDEEILWDGLIK